MMLRISVTALLILLSTVACAMTQVTFTTGDLLDNAEHVVLARLKHMQIDAGAGVLMSRTGHFHFEIDEVIKGDPPLRDGELVLRLGGVTAAGAPFAPDERVVLFLGKTNRDGYPTLYGSPQTVLRVVEATREFPHPARHGGGPKWVIGNGVTGIAGAPADPAAARRVTLDEFLAAARARVAESKQVAP